MRNWSAKLWLGVVWTSSPTSLKSSRSLSPTSLPPRALLERAQHIERAFGRDRTRDERWGPRTLDIDILAYGDAALDEPGLTLPHPRLFARAFVLAPLAEIAPDRVIAGITVSEALARIGMAGIEKLPPR